MSKQSAYFRIPGLAGEHEAREIKRRLAGIPGVMSVSVSQKEGKVAVDYDSTGTDFRAIGEKLRAFETDAQFLENQDHVM